MSEEEEKNENLIRGVDEAQSPFIEEKEHELHTNDGQQLQTPVSTLQMNPKLVSTIMFGSGGSQSQGWSGISASPIKLRKTKRRIGNMSPPSSLQTPFSISSPQKRGGKTKSQTKLYNKYNHPVLVSQFQDDDGNLFYIEEEKEETETEYYDRKIKKTGIYFGVYTVFYFFFILILILTQT